MNEIDDLIELQKIGGIQRYELYCERIKEFLSDNPHASAIEISMVTGVPLLAVKRAIRLHVVSYIEPEKENIKTDKNIKNNKKTLSQKRNQLIESLKVSPQKTKYSDSKLVQDLNNMYHSNSKFTKGCSSSGKEK